MTDLATQIQEAPSTTDRVLVVDFGSQTTQLIARRCREEGVFSEVWPFHVVTEEALRAFAPKAIILSGGPKSVLDEGSPSVPMVVFELGVPVLGICYGEQLMAKMLGGRVGKGGKQEEYGHQVLDFHYAEANHLLFHPEVWMSHGDQVTELPPGFAPLASTPGSSLAMIADVHRKFLGVQFHPEVTHTPGGRKLFRVFLKEWAGCKGDLTPTRWRGGLIGRIRDQVGKAKVVCAMSGGVDSAVLARLLDEAIGDQLTCVHVDNGLMRKGESDELEDVFRQHFTTSHLIRANAGERFLNALGGVADPEKKRKIIGGLFIDVFEEQARIIGDVDFLAQGTIYPDVIESQSVFGGPTSVIKSHHNVGGLPARMRMKLVEPLRMMFKDEVRALGRELGLPDIFVGRHPFPGPGLAIRVPGEVEPWKVEMVREADFIFLEEIRRAGLYDDISQAYAAFDSTRAVGKMGDARQEGYLAILRAVKTDDYMSCSPYDDFPKGFLTHVGNRICNEVKGPGGQRFVGTTYVVTGKPPGTTELE